jgi:hypothetical protein
MGNGTEIITVQAGASFSFTADVQVYHDGPLSMYVATETFLKSKWLMKYRAKIHG